MRTYFFMIMCPSITLDGPGISYTVKQLNAVCHTIIYTRLTTLIFYWKFLLILGTPSGVRQNSSKCLPFISMLIADWFSKVQR